MTLKVYNVKEVAELLKVTERYVRKIIKDGDLEAKKVARKYIITEEQLKKYLESGN